MSKFYTPWWETAAIVMAILLAVVIGAWLLLFAVFSLDVSGFFSYIDPARVACNLFGDANDTLCQ